MGIAASKIFVEGIIGHMYIMNEIIASVKIIHYGYIKLGKAMDVKCEAVKCSSTLEQCRDETSK